MRYDVIVIGGGQAGLAVGYYLRKTNFSYLILDRDKQMGQQWRDRYDSLVLFTPRLYSALPGLTMAGDPQGYPSKDEMADYLELYGKSFHLSIMHNQEVIKIDHTKDGFIIFTSNTQFESKRIVLATGAFQTPFVPPFAGQLSADVVQMHSSEYRNPKQLQRGTTLIVGGGNSGAQIATECSEHQETYLAVSQPLRFLPLTIMKKSIFWWFEQLGLLAIDIQSRLGKRMRTWDDPIFGYTLKQALKQKKVMQKGRVIQAEGSLVSFNDRTQIEVKNVIWATGFKQMHPFFQHPSLYDQNGKIKHQHGVTEIKGCYVIGLPWLHRRGSSLILGVGEDAQFLVKHM
ncbi:NAD(P)-binding domain-containing protein [Hazenella sp. IB182357]|uniref:NAD(P)-binding domain-containing protein n=2 Tax=Polycladospora coralii TaxID=2771432 RepID=A0A926RWT5_9BACL|nr:NAD(P)/FAD-dependent oxidoreductase [Polycladospora coralii]MBD1371851.1 NAD(P)-binding domain-containing protein [Polycladospora coralii]